MNVNSYGLHRAGGIPFLVQPAGAQNLISPALDCPFVPDPRLKRMRCPHHINLSNVSPAPDWLSDPLAQVFLPTPLQPGEKARLLLDREGRCLPLLAELARLSSPVEPMSRPIWWKSTKSTVQHYTVSNITPLVWTHCSMDHTQEAARHIDMAAANQRRILIVCKEDVPLFGSDLEWIETELTTISAEPLETIGAGALKRAMQDG